MERGNLDLYKWGIDHLWGGTSKEPKYHTSLIIVCHLCLQIMNLKNNYLAFLSFDYNGVCLMNVITEVRHVN